MTKKVSEVDFPIDKGLIIRMAVLVFSYVNLFLVNRGISPLPIDESRFEEDFSLVLAFAVTLWVGWKNNNITKKAREDAKIVEDVNELNKLREKK